MRFYLGVALCISLFILAAGYDERASYDRQHVTKKKAPCPKGECLDKPMACFVHGGAPQAPACLRD